MTQNGVPGGAAGTADVDGGPTVLTSPPFDFADGDGFVGGNGNRAPTGNGRDGGDGGDGVAGRSSTSLTEMTTSLVYSG